jgi:hypothetical protein
MTLIVETQAEGEAILVIDQTGRQLVNMILFDTENVPEPVRHLATILCGGYVMFDKAQDAAKALRELRDMPPAGQA